MYHFHKGIVFFSLIFFLLFSTKLFASVLSLSLPSLNSDEWFTKVSAGAGITTIGKTQNINMVTGVRQYTGQNREKFAGLLGVTLGYIANIGETVQWRFGISGDYASYATSRGTVAPITGIALTSSYRFSTRSYFLLQQNQFIWVGHHWDPFVLMGVGMAWNHLNGYQETQNNAAPVSYLLLFRPYTSFSFAFEGGAGVERELSAKLRLEFSYHYLNAGEGELDSAPLQTGTSRFKSGNLAMHLLEASILF